MRKHIPNALSFSRILFAAFFLLTYDPEQKAAYLIGVTLLAVGFGTDAFDGLLARRWGVTSAQGYVLDGLGDRAMYIGGTLTLVATGRLAPSLAWLVVFRELLLYGLRSVPRHAWYPVPARDRLLTKAHALAIRVWLFTCFFADGVRLFGRYDLYGNMAFRIALGLLLATAILVAYYAFGTALWRLWTGSAREDVKHGNRRGG
ncbi:MAG: CDP-alcohol phosphatidyltransferase family protein [Longimicrobiaceae bacterium]